MDTDALIEQLAFGKTTPKLNSCLGLYLSPELVYLAEVRLEGGKPIVDKSVKVPLPVQSAKGAVTTLNTDFLNDTVKVGQAIRQAMAQHRWNSKDLVITLSHHLGLLRYFTMPQIERRFWALSVPAEAKKYIPIPMDALAHDFQVGPASPGADGRPRQGALFAVSPKKVLPQVLSVAADLDLKLLAIELAPCSAMRLWSSLDAAKSESFCQVHFDGGNVRVIISSDGLPVFFREVFMGAEASVQDTRKIDLAGCLSYVQKQLGLGKLSQIRVSGATAEIARWQEIFSQEIGMPVSFLDAPTQLGVKGGDWGSYAAIGAGLRFLSSSPLNIDVLGTGRISEIDRRTARNIFVGGGISAAAILAMGLAVYGQVTIKENELRKYKREADIEDAFTGRTSDDIEKLLGGMREQLSYLRASASEQDRVTEVLKELVATLPEKMWITRLNLVIPTRDPNGRELIVGGYISGATVTEEQESAVAIKDSLLKNPLIGRLFPEMQVEIKNNLPSQQVLASLSQDALKRTLEGRTEWVIIGKTRRGP